jgi:hypothetical protein
LGRTETKNSVHENIKHSLNSKNACDPAVQNLCLSGFVYKYKEKGTIILPVVLYWRETWPLTLREHSLRVFHKRVLMTIFGPTKDEVAEEEKITH